MEGVVKMNVKRGHGLPLDARLLAIPVRRVVGAVLVI